MFFFYCPKMKKINTKEQKNEYKFSKMDVCCLKLLAYL